MKKIFQKTRIIPNFLKKFLGTDFQTLKHANAVVESEHAFACDDNGEQIRFMVNQAKKHSVITMEEAIERLALVH